MHGLAQYPLHKCALILVQCIWQLLVLANFSNVTYHLNQWFSISSSPQSIVSASPGLDVQILKPHSRPTDQEL